MASSNLAIPAYKDDITVDWMQKALIAGGISDFPILKDITVENIGAGAGMMGELVRCHLTYRDDTTAAPKTVIAKLSATHPKNLRMSRRLSLYEREYNYYRYIASHMSQSLRSPRLFYGDFEDGSHRFVLLLEDLRNMEIPDQIRGASAEMARRVVRGVARMHGLYWNKVDHPSLAKAKNLNSLRYRTLIQIVYLLNLVPMLDRFGNFFSAEVRQLAEAYGPKVASHISSLATAPSTFIHGDFRLDNMFFGSSPEDDFVVIDWQASGISNGLYDVAYFLGGSVATDIRRRIEHETLQEYHDIVCRMGAEDFTFTKCWQLYRQNMLGRLLIISFACGGLDFANDRGRKLAETCLQRTLAAIDDLHADEFLPTSSGSLGTANILSTLSGCAYKLHKFLYHLRKTENTIVSRV